MWEIAKGAPPLYYGRPIWTGYSYPPTQNSQDDVGFRTWMLSFKIQSESYWLKWKLSEAALQQGG